MMKATFITSFARKSEQMLIEFIGLPTAGKTTLAGHYVEWLNAHSPDKKANYLRKVAHGAQVDARRHIKYIKRRIERVDLYGAVLYGHKNPGIFQFLSQFSQINPTIIYSNLEFLSELHYADAIIKSPSIVVTDEGLMHRGVAAMIGHEEKPDLYGYLSKLPKESLILYVNISIDLAIHRAKQLRGKLPYRRGYQGRDPEEILQETWENTRYAIESGRNLGLRIVELDGERPVETLRKQMCQLII